MKVIKAAMSGTMESCDCQVTIEPGNGIISFNLESAVINQYGNRIKQVTMQTLKNLNINDVNITIIDKGALDCTIKARIESAVYRSLGQFEQMPWGGAIK